MPVSLFLFHSTHSQIAFPTGGHSTCRFICENIEIDDHSASPIHSLAVLVSNK